MHKQTLTQQDTHTKFKYITELKFVCECVCVCVVFKYTIF